MSNLGAGEDPLQPEIDAVIGGAENLLEGTADRRLVDDRKIMHGLKSSADFARSVVNSLQVGRGCFNPSVMDEVMQTDDIGLQIFTIGEMEDALREGVELPYHDVLHRFANGLAGLHTLLSSELVKAKSPDVKDLWHPLLVDASRAYNATFACLTVLIPDDETLELAQQDLEFYLAPLTVGHFEYDEEGFAKAPEMEVNVNDIIQATLNEVHDQFDTKLAEALPPHDFNSRFRTMTLMILNSTAEDILRLHENPRSAELEDFSGFVKDTCDLAVDAHMGYSREKYFPNMDDLTAEEIKTIINEYLKSMLEVLRQFGKL